jgi:hypothetical protein
VTIRQDNLPARKHPSKKTPQQEDASARRRLSRTAITPSLNDLVPTLTEVMKTILKVMLEQSVIMRMTMSNSDLFTAFCYHF